MTPLSSPGVRNAIRLAVFKSAALCLGLAPVSLHAENLVPNGGFEETETTWGVFIPQESENKGCELLISEDSPHSGSACAEIKSGDFARFSAYPKKIVGDPLRPGDRAKLSFWIRAGKDLKAKGDPGVVVRIFLLDSQGQNLPSSYAFFVGLNGNVSLQPVNTPPNFSELKAEVPTEWTKVEAVFDVPSDMAADRLNRPEFFGLYTSGSVFLDDISLERVAADTPLSPLSKY